MATTGEKIAELKRREKEAGEHADLQRELLIELRKQELALEKKKFKTDADFKALKRISQMRAVASKNVEELSYKAQNLYATRRLNILLRIPQRRKSIPRRL